MSGSKSAKKILKTRLDELLVARGLAPTEQIARAMIMAGEIRVDGQPAAKPGAMIATDAPIEIAGGRQKYSSRSGLKLEGALADFEINVKGCICLDVGASNGGFTDCLLQRGASRVYAVDVNTAQLDWKLQRDARVIAIKKNARHLKAGDLPENPDFVCIDVSFISAAKVLSAVVALAKPDANLLILIKPQFELPKNLVGKGGIVSDPELHERAIASVKAAVERAGLAVFGVKPSRITGAEGNREFFLHARRIR
ncbi:MAG TPA: TlyA family RNA methyltransferase [Candidatus Acidoferrales bacterium]|nr:TlyA family RNA methyltransferase [Candidatus Acidoferrales bacterium]